MSNIRLANDRKTLFGTSIGETVKVHKEIRDDSYFRFDNVPNGVNRINFFCEKEGLYDVQVWQHIETLSPAGGTTVCTSTYIPDGALNHNAMVLCYTTPKWTYPTSDVRFSTINVTSLTTVTTGFVKTPAATGLVVDTGNTATVSVFAHYGFTTAKLVATLPLAALYNDNYDLTSADRTIHVNVVGVGSSPIEIQLTEEQGRTAVTSTGGLT